MDVGAGVRQSPPGLKGTLTHRLAVPPPRGRAAILILTLSGARLSPGAKLGIAAVALGKPLRLNTTRRAVSCCLCAGSCVDWPHVPEEFAQYQ